MYMQILGARSTLPTTLTQQSCGPPVHHSTIIIYGRIRPSTVEADCYRNPHGGLRQGAPT